MSSFFNFWKRISGKKDAPLISISIIHDLCSITKSFQLHLANLLGFDIIVLKQATHQKTPSKLYQKNNAKI